MNSLHPLKGPDALKLGVFSANADGGLAITDVPERWRASWDDNLEAARIADRAGLDFLLPIARWAGFGGKNKVREWSFETFTWAAALAAATSRIGLFMTVHVPLVHPLYAAKALATVDHISHGRAGLNIVCGWNPKEFAMFGIPLSDKGYDQAAEWLYVIEKAYASDVPFDFDGRYYTLKDVVSRPASVQQPRPVTMNALSAGQAAISPPGIAISCSPPSPISMLPEITSRISARAPRKSAATSASTRYAMSFAARHRPRPTIITSAML